MGKRLITLALLAAFAGNAWGEEPKGPTKSEKGKAKTAAKPKPLSKAETERLTRTLESDRESEVLSALNEISAIGPGAAGVLPALHALFTRGANVPVIVAACDSAAALGSTETSPLLVPYVRHRNPEIRQAALRALVRTRGGPAVGALRQALKSPDPALRGLAATGLGELGAREAVDDLFQVLAKDGLETPEAAVPIATLCAPAQCDRLMGLVGKIKFETLEPAFVPLLSRPPSDVPEENQLKYIDRLRRLATKRATAVLTVTLAQLPENASPRLRRALDLATRGISLQSAEEEP